jgi:hypothetical protein
LFPFFGGFISKGTRMKKIGCSVLLGCVLQASLEGQQVSQGVGANTNVQVLSAGPTIVERSANSRIWATITSETNENGDISLVTNNAYTELATGICYIDPNSGQYVDSVEEVVSVPGGAKATQGRYQVSWALNANTPAGAVTVTTADGKHLLSTVFGLAWYDLASGSNAPIGRLKDCNGAINAPNQVVYSDDASVTQVSVLTF